MSAVHVSALLTLFSLPSGAQGSDLDVFIQDKMREARVPGLAASIIKNNQVVWAKGYGYANIELGVPATADTPFFLASVSKTVTGTAMMQLSDLGAFQLDENVNNYLPFPVKNPNHQSAPITFRQLMSHASSIRDNWNVMDPLYTPGDSPHSLAFFLSEYLAPGGQWYYPNQNYYQFAPGQNFEYANVGFALVGHMVERVSGRRFERFCDNMIFGPLGMHDTGWRLSDFDPATVAMPYFYNAGSQSFVPYGHYGYPDWPAGTLRSSVLDLSKFLLVHINQGNYGGAQILRPSTVTEMQTVQYPQLDPTQGLAFYYWNIGGQTLIGHDGGDPGVLTDMWFRPVDKVGVILLVNGNAQFAPYIQIFLRLLSEADAF